MGAQVDGARIPPNSALIAQCRSRSMSSMLSAPQPFRPPGTPTVRCALDAALAARPRRGSATRSASPARLRPGHHRDQAGVRTRFGSQNMRESSPGYATIAT